MRARYGWMKWVLWGAALGLLTGALFAQEGLDPMRVVYLQQAHPVLEVVMDSSGSLSFPLDARQGEANNVDYGTSTISVNGSNVTCYYYKWHWSNPYGAAYNSSSSTNSAGVPAYSPHLRIFGDESIDLHSDTTNNNFRTGQGNWIRAASMNGNIYSSSPPSGGTAKVTVYVGGNWSWTKSSFSLSDTASTYYISTVGTLIDIWNVSGADNGTYAIASTPTQLGDFWYFTVRQVASTPVKKGSTWYLKVEGTSATSTHTFLAASATDTLASAKVMMATATASINQSTQVITWTHSPAQAAWYYLPPSRMATLKNALGNYVSLYEPISASLTGCGPFNDNYTVTINSVVTHIRQYYLIPDASGTGLAWGAQRGPWDGPFYDYAFDRIISNTPARGTIETTWTTKALSNYGTAPAAGFTTASAPKDVIGTSTYVNWGFGTFNGSCPGFTSRVAPIASDVDSTQQTVRNGIEAYLRPADSGGIYPDSSTPTRSGLQGAVTPLNTALQADATSCARTYAMLLVTDGQSNNCNPSSGEWSLASPACPTNSTSCGGCLGSGAYPGNTSSGYPPRDSDHNWTTGITKGTTKYPIRTYVVGVSQDVSVCELNWIAYYGRTDAFATDFGFATTSDTRLPGGSPGTYDYSGVNGQHYYALFANDANDIQNAVEAILATMGAGDYTTSPPVSNNGATGSLGFKVYLGSAEFSSLHGHLYSYDYSTGSAVFYWDLGMNLSYPKLGTNYQPVAAPGPYTVDNPAYTSADNRTIWTWDPATNAMIPIPAAPTLAQAQALDTLAGFTGNPVFAKTATVTLNGHANTVIYPIIDFMRGKYYDLTSGTYKARAWNLGALLNVTPALVGPPDHWTDPNPVMPNHGDTSGGYEYTYQNRHWLCYAGADDGMVHAADCVDGAEVFAMMLPNCLANQPALFYNFINQVYGTLHANGTDTGEPKTFEAHIYGVANSPRYSDIAFCPGGVCPPPPGTAYKTVMFLAEGGGGNDPQNAPPSLADFIGWPSWLGWGTWEWTASTVPRSAMYVVDVTHPYKHRTITLYTGTLGAHTSHDWPDDMNYDTLNDYPFTPLGFVDSNSTDGAGHPLNMVQSWSIPAIASNAANKWSCLMGSGYNPASEVSPTLNQVSPKGFQFDPTTFSAAGAMQYLNGAALTYAATGIVGDQAFADAILWQKSKEYFSTQWLADQGVLSDFNGSLWFLDNFTTGLWTKGVNVQPGNPIYYSPTVTYWSFNASNRWDLYGFASGTFYEKAAAVTGGSLCTSGNFCPRMYIVANNEYSPAALPILFNGTTNTANVWSTTLSGLPWVDTSSGVPVNKTTSASTQPVGSAFSLTSEAQNAPPLILFALYDPYSGTCAGDSFVVTTQANPSATGGMASHGAIGSPAGGGGSGDPHGGVFHAHSGVIGGMSVVGNQVVVSISGVGSGAHATVVTVPNISISSPTPGSVPLSWIELK